MYLSLAWLVGAAAAIPLVGIVVLKLQVHDHRMGRQWPIGLWPHPTIRWSNRNYRLSADLPPRRT